MLALRIALRYLFAPKSHKAVNIISIISMAGVAVATMAIVVVLSVFNGFSDLARTHLAFIDPDIKIVPAKGKVIAEADSVAAAMRRLPGVDAAMVTLSERGLLTAGDRQKPVVFKGIDPASAHSVMDIDKIIIDGIYTPDNGLPDSTSATQISVGVAIDLNLRPSPYRAAELYVPRRTGRINPANPAASYRALPLAVSAVTQVDQPEYDADYIFISLADARRLLEYDDATGSAIEIKAAKGADTGRLRARMKAALGPEYIVQNRVEQQAETFRMIAVEKWVTFLMLIFILLIASFNIVSTLSLLVIEKRDNMATLRALGAPRRLIKNIFIAEGWLITAFGGIIGTVLGIALSMAQQYLGIIKLKGDPSALSVDVYPVRLDWADVAIVLGAVVLTGFLIAQLSRLFTRKIK